MTETGASVGAAAAKPVAGKRTRIFYLDLVRALAALLIVLTHFLLELFIAHPTERRTNTEGLNIKNNKKRFLVAFWPFFRKQSLLFGVVALSNKSFV